MDIREDFKPYVDKNDLMSPGPVNGDEVCDNGVMYLSEFFIMLKKMNLLYIVDEEDYNLRISACIDKNGLLNRRPIGQTASLEGPDDYYAVLNGCIELGNTEIPRKFLGAIFKYVGCMNNVSPGTWSIKSFLARQPQIVAAMVAAGFPSMKNPVHYIIRGAAFPLFLISAIVLATSCIGTDVGDTDARRLAWHLGNCNSKVSLMNLLAYRFFMRRLLKMYPNGMKDVAAIYYQPKNGNPFAKWWVD